MRRLKDASAVRSESPFGLAAHEGNAVQAGCGPEKRLGRVLATIFRRRLARPAAN